MIEYYDVQHFQDCCVRFIEIVEHPTGRLMGLARDVGVAAKARLTRHECTWLKEA